MAPQKHQSTFASAPEEWTELDASRIARTFIASFRDPTLHTPQNSPKKDQSALSRLTDTLSTLLSPRSTRTSASASEEENTQVKLSKLQNPYYTSPSHDLCDTIMRPFFLRGSRFFRNNTWPRHMHVIDLGAYFASPDPLVQAASPRLCDAVATVLSHTSAECVESFLDPGVMEFVYKREVEGRKGGNMVIVRREGNSIVVSKHVFSKPTLLLSKRCKGVCFWVLRLTTRRQDVIATWASRCNGACTSELGSMRLENGSMSLRRRGRVSRRL